MSRYPEPGTRVFVILRVEEHAVFAFGMGTYVGVHDCPYMTAATPDQLRAIALAFGDKDFVKLNDEQVELEVQKLADTLPAVVGKNPKIELDRGGHVWGCEAWWQVANSPQEVLQDQHWVLVSPVRDENGCVTVVRSVASGLSV